MGDELGMGNDPGWASGPGHAGDNRWVHRPRMDWGRAAQRVDPVTVAGRIFTGIAHLARVRASLAHFHAAVPAEVLDVAEPGVLPVLRRHPVGPLLGLYNVTESWQPWPGHRVAEAGLSDPLDALRGEQVPLSDGGNRWLPPYAAVWLVQRP